jgi:hypothetical protein
LSHALSLWGLEFPIARTDGWIVESLAEKPDNFSLPHYGHHCEIIIIIINFGERGAGVGYILK